MEIELRNFGPIKKLVFDLDKDIHLLYGENAIGKSYATYGLYCLIKNLKNKFITDRVLFVRQDKNIFETDLNILNALVKSSNLNEPINCTKEFAEVVENRLKGITIESIENSLNNTFSSLKNLKNRYNNSNYQLILHVNKNKKLVFFSNDDGKLNLKLEDSTSNLSILQKNTKSTKFTLINNGKKCFGSPSEVYFMKTLSFYISDEANSILNEINSKIQDIYYLPASRSGLYQALNAFTPIIAELTQNRFFMQQKNIELPSLSEPLADYFIDLSTLNIKHTNTEYKPIISELENNILRGTVEYDENTKRILYKPIGINLELNLSEASSMVAELSPLVVFLKHILNNKYTSYRNMENYYFREITGLTRKKNKLRYDILFIEEPEAHMHPEVQVKLMEIFSKLSFFNLKIFITSHSNYMFNKINNLIISNDIQVDKVKVYHLIRDNDNTTILGTMKVTQEGINDDNFQDVSAKLYYERLNILRSEQDKKN